MRGGRRASKIKALVDGKGRVRPRKGRYARHSLNENVGVNDMLTLDMNFSLQDFSTITMYLINVESQCMICTWNAETLVLTLFINKQGNKCKSRKLWHILERASFFFTIQQALI